jgi:hypothetical protein
MNPDRFFGMRTCAWVALFLVSAGCFSSFETEPRDGAVPIDGGFDAGVDVGAPDASTLREVSLRVVHFISLAPLAGAEVAFRAGDFASTVRSDERGIARARIVGSPVVDVEVVVEGFVARTSLAVRVEELDGVDYPLESIERVTIGGRCIGQARDDSLLLVRATAGVELSAGSDGSFSLAVPVGVPVELRCLEIAGAGSEIVTSTRSNLPALDADLDGVELVLEPARTRRRVVQVPRAPVGHSLHESPLGVSVRSGYGGPSVGMGRLLGRSEDAYEVELTWVDDVERPTLALLADGGQFVRAFVEVDQLASFSWIEVPRFPRRASPGNPVSFERAAPITFVAFGEDVERSESQLLWFIDSESPSFVVPEPPAHLRTFPFSVVVVGGAAGDRLGYRFDQLSLQGARP